MAQSPDNRQTSGGDASATQDVREGLKEADRRAQATAAQATTQPPQQAATQASEAQRSAVGAAQGVAAQGAGATQQAARQMGTVMRQSSGAAAEITEAGAQFGAETARRSGHTLADGQRQIIEEIAGRFERMAQRLAQAMQESSADLRVLTVPSPAAAENLRELQEGMAGFVSGVVQSHMRATSEFFRLADPAAVFDLQRRFMREYLDNLMQGTGAFLRVSRQHAEDTLRPLESHIEQRQQRQEPAQHGHGVVADVMTSDVRLVTPEDTVQQASRIMREEDTGVLPVGEGDRLVGIVTDRDVTLRLVAEGKDPARTKVREVMSAEPRYVFEDEDLDHAADNMAEQQVRRLPVLNRNKRLVGIVSLGDLSHGQGGARRAGRAMRGVSREGDTPTAAA
jgi:CBS domain-containing protein